MIKTRQSGFIDRRFAGAVLAMALLAGLAMATETGREPVASVPLEDAAPSYVIPDARIAPFIELLFYD